MVFFFCEPKLIMVYGDGIKKVGPVQPGTMIANANGSGISLARLYTCTFLRRKHIAALSTRMWLGKKLVNDSWPTTLFLMATDCVRFYSFYYSTRSYCNCDPPTCPDAI
jgi:hypothetical protein